MQSKLNRRNAMNHIAKSVFLLAICVLGLAFGQSAFSQSYYSITDLGTLGGSDSVPYRVNNCGEVTGYSHTASGATDAFLYSDGVLYDLGTLPGFVGSNGNDINDFGQVVGDLAMSGGSGLYHGFLYSDGVMQDLGTPSGYMYSEALGINAFGQISGRGITTPGIFPAGGHAALYSGGTWYDLGTLGGQWSTSEIGINSAGQFTGQSATASGSTHTFLWTPNVPNGTTGTMIDLGTLGGMDDGAGLSGINSQGQVVGSVAGGGHALLFTGGAVIDLGSCIPGGSGWSMVYASSISDTGYIGGQGVINGQYHAYLMTPNFHLSTLTLTPSTQAGSLNISGKLTLNQTAPFDLAVSLANSNLAALAPTTVVIPAGTTSKSFTLKTYPVSGSYTGYLTAQYYGVTLAKAYTVRPIGVKSVTLSAYSVSAGSSVSGTVTLEAKAAPGPITVSFVSTNPAVAPNPPSITIPAGSQTGGFTVSTNAGSSGTTTIKATANGITKASKTLTVQP